LDKIIANKSADLLNLPSNLQNALLRLPKYGTPGSRLLPHNLLHEWGKEPISGSWIKDLGFQDDTIRLEELELRFQAGDSFHGNMDIHTKKIEDWTEGDFEFVSNYFIEFARTNFINIQNMTAVPQYFPTILVPANLPWSRRTYNALKKLEWLKNFESLKLITYKDLSKIKNLGIKSVLELAVVIENSIELASKHSLPGQNFYNLSAADADTDNNQPFFDMKFLNGSIDQMNLPVRAQNCLKNMDINLVKELIFVPKINFFKIRNFGRKTLSDIESCLIEKKLSLGMRLVDSAIQFGLHTPVEALGLNKDENEKLHNLNFFSINELLPLTEVELQNILPTSNKYSIRRLKDGLALCKPYLKQSEIINFALKENSNSQPQNFDALERLALEPWAEEVQYADPRFKDLLSFSGNLFEIINELLIASKNKSLDANGLRLILTLQENETFIRKRIEELSSLSIESAIKLLVEQILGNRIKESTLNIILNRNGWSGNQPKTLEEVGKPLGITRERVRQIVKLFEKKCNFLIGEERLFFPQVERGLKLLEDAQPISLDDAAKMFYEKNISEKPFHIKSFLNLAQFVGADHGFIIKDSYLTQTSELNIRQLVTYAKKLCGYNGVANILEVLDGLEHVENITKDIARKLLEDKRVGLFFLTDEWFLNPKTSEHRNRLINTAKYMLSVTSPLKLSDIRKGLLKKYANRDSSSNVYRGLLQVPPSNILEEFFKYHPSFEFCEPNLVSYKKNLDMSSTIGNVEGTMVNVLLKSPSGILSRKNFLKECKSRDININSFTAFLSASPLFIQVDYNIWGLVGRDYNPATVAALQNRTRLAREKHPQTFGWTDDGNIWIAKKVSYNLVSFLMYCPANLRRYFDGVDFTLMGENGKPFGLVKLSGDMASLYGFQPFITRKGVEENDILKAEFNLSNKTCMISFAQEDIFDE
jgi:hypothetical protein